MDNATTELSREECLLRLAGASVGRIAVTDKALPVIVPVNFTVAGPSVVFRTESGGMLAHACDGSVVAFEVDELSADGLSGWSVLVIGVADLLRGSEALRALELGLVTAPGKVRDQFVAITMGRVSGRKSGVDRDRTSIPAGRARPALTATELPVAQDVS